MGYISGYQGNLNPALSVNMSIGTTSDVITTGGLSLVGIKLPATFTGTTLTFLMCDTVGGTYVSVNNSSGPVSYTVAQNKYYAIDPKDFHGIQFLKIVSGSSEASARTIICALKGF